VGYGGQICYGVAVVNWFAPITKKDAVLIASRVVTIYFLAWLVSDLLLIPGDISRVHFFTVWTAHTRSAYDANLRSDEIRLLCVHVIRVALAFLAAGWAYRCGPSVARFLFPDSEQSTNES
jgi:hypothetical protein